MKKKFLHFVNKRYSSTFGLAGDFTKSQHLNFLLKAEEIWKEGKFSDNLKAHADSLIKQLQNQTAKFQELDNKDKDNSVDVTWLKMCGETTSDFVDDERCEVNGNELETDSKTYAYDRGQKWGFSINEEKIRTGTYEVAEQVAYGLMEGDKLLSEWWNKQLLLFYKASAGDNIAVIKDIDDIFSWNSGTKTAEVGAGNYNVGIIASLIQQMIINQVNTGWYVNDGTLFQSWKNAGLDSGNLDGDGNDKRTKEIDLMFDMWNFAAAGLSENMFLVDRNAIALKTYTRYTDAPVVKGGKINQTRYRMKSNILPGVYWDVVYELKCVDGEDIHTWELRTKGGIFLNPEPCPITINGTQYTPNGVWMFSKTA